jgi:hypothetical protein
MVLIIIVSSSDRLSPVCQTCFIFLINIGGDMEKQSRDLSDILPRTWCFMDRRHETFLPRNLLGIFFLRHLQLGLVRPIKI